MPNYSDVIIHYLHALIGKVHSTFRRAKLILKCKLFRKKFWNNHAAYTYETYGFRPGLSYKIFQQKLEEIKPNSLLELGCGYGRYFSLYENIPRVVATDISREMLQKIPGKYQQLPNFSIVCVAAEDINFDDMFDVTITNMALQHVPPKLIRRAIENICRCSMHVLIHEWITQNHAYIFGHNYEELFDSFGFSVVEKYSTDEPGKMFYHFCGKDIK